MHIFLFALAGAACALPVRLLAQRMAQARGGQPGEGRLLYGPLAAALFMGLCASGFALISAVLSFADIVRLLQSLLVFLVLVCLSAVDIATRRIPNELLLALLLIYALGHTFSGGWAGVAGNLAGAAIAAVLFVFPAHMGLYPMGWGDIKYAVVIGFCFGLIGLLQVTLVMGLGLGLYMAYLLISRRGGLKSPTAIGPYLSLGAMVTMVFPVFSTIF